MGNCLLTKGKENLQMDLLWTNPNPTTRFSVQTVSLDLSNYSIVLITAIRVGDYANYKFLNALLVPSTGNIIGTDNNSCLYRQAQVTTTGIYFPGDVDIIPQQIYGIKQFKFIQKYVSGLPGIDTNNVIAEPNTATYTATQDCWVEGYSTGNINTTINGAVVLSAWGAGFSSSYNMFILPLKSGQTIACTQVRHVYGVLGE